MQFAWCFHNAPVTISCKEWVYTADYGKPNFCAGEALQSRAEVRHSNAGSILLLDA
jgi:hypothetical protein